MKKYQPLLYFPFTKTPILINQFLYSLNACHSRFILYVCTILFIVQTLRGISPQAHSRNPWESICLKVTSSKSALLKERTSSKLQRQTTTTTTTVPDLKLFEPGSAGKSSLWMEKSGCGSAGLDTTP